MYFVWSLWDLLEAIRGELSEQCLAQTEHLAAPSWYYQARDSCTLRKQRTLWESGRFCLPCIFV